MKKILLVALCCLFSITFLSGAGADEKNKSNNNKTVTAANPPSRLFDNLGMEPDVVYLIANSSVIFGPDPHGRSEEVTFVGPVTVPKWPMKGYNRRVLPDGRQQIDIELTQSELTGESYVLGGPVVLGEHPDLRSLGTITERPRTELMAKADRADRMADVSKSDKSDKKETKNAKKETKKAAKKEDAKEDASAEEVPADFVVERKVLMTTAKGILYNETAVPVRGRIDSIPPVKLQGTPTGVNTFRGMELPIALLDKDGDVNGWFYSKAHMAYAVLPAGIERSYIKGSLELRSNGKTETVQVAGPAEIHHLTAPQSAATTNMEIMVLALRGHSDLLGGDVMVAETFSDRDHFSRGTLDWTGNNANAKFDLYIDLYTPSSKLTTNQPIEVAGQLADCQVSGHLAKGKLNLPLIAANGHFTSQAPRSLYNETEKAVVDVVKFNLDVAPSK